MTLHWMMCGMVLATRSVIIHHSNVRKKFTKKKKPVDLLLFSSFITNFHTHTPHTYTYVAYTLLHTVYKKNCTPGILASLHHVFFLNWFVLLLALLLLLLLLLVLLFCCFTAIVSANDANFHLFLRSSIGFFFFLLFVLFLLFASPFCNVRNLVGGSLWL